MEFRNPEDIEEEKLDIQMAPLIDIVFLLLIFFLCATAFFQLEKNINLDLPVFNENPDSDKPMPVVIDVKQNRQYFIGPDKYNANTLQARLTRMKRFEPDQTVIIRGSNEVIYDDIAGALDACTAVGIENLILSPPPMDEND